MEFLVFKEDKKKIEKIKKKYKNVSMSDEVASKINKLEITNKLLGHAMLIAGFATVIDFVAPDPVLFLDEAGLVAITTCLKFVRGNIKFHIKDLAKNGDTEISDEEVNSLASRLIGVAKEVKSSRRK